MWCPTIGWASKVLLDSAPYLTSIEGVIPTSPSLTLRVTNRTKRVVSGKASAAENRTTLGPADIVDRMGVEPIAPILQGSVATIGMPARV